MHEVGIARNLLELVEEAARREGAHEVRTVALRVGVLSGVEPDALAFAFDVCKRDTLAAEARLEIERVPLRCRCERCDRVFVSDDRHGVALCPDCGRPSGALLSGDELELRWLDIV